MTEKLIVFNWKMNPLEAKQARALGVKIKKIASRLKKVHTIIAPPTVFLPLLAPAKPSRRWSLAAQDVSVETEPGAYTGEVAGAMLRSVGVKYVIVGHSERRAKGESDEVVRAKVAAALAAGLKVILCVGESARDTHGGYLDFLRGQLLAALRPLERADYKNLVVAYEPVWAIGANATTADSPDHFLHNALFIRKVVSGLVGQETALKLPILYGGSVKADNAESFLETGRANGLLIGRASLEPDNFKIILTEADKVRVKTKTKK